MYGMPRAVLRALCRAREPIVWIGMTYLLGVVVGAGMVHAHNGFALRYGDELVGRAQQSDPAAKAMNRRLPVRAALADFTGNLFLGAAPSTVMGLSVVLPFPWAGISRLDRRDCLGGWRAQEPPEGCA